MIGDSPLPDVERWDGRADEQEVRAWLEALRERPHGPELHLLAQLRDGRAAPVLREYSDDPDRRIADVALRALGCCGSVEDDGERLLTMARSGELTSDALLGTLTELGVPGTVELLRDLLGHEEPGSRGELKILDRLVWLRDYVVADRILELIQERAFLTAYPMSRPLCGAAFRVGAEHHRAQMADMAVDLGRRMVGSERTSREMHILHSNLEREWSCYESNAIAVWAPEFADVLRRVDSSPESQRTGRKVTRQSRGLPPIIEYGERVVPSTWLRVASAPDTGAWPPAKFLGQPDWRDDPAWPVANGSVPLVFYGQLPLPGTPGRTAYIFLGGPSEWEPLGPGSAVVVQPGNLCHLPTVRLEQGPQEWTSVWDGGYRNRRRGVPHPEVLLELVPSSDPVSWDHPIGDPDPSWARDDERDWNKIGGTPRWLQAPESPGEGWDFFGQFTAGVLATERGDGAECYLWQHPDGRVAFGWQCH